VLYGELTGLRPRTDADIEIFETELLTDGVTLSQPSGEWSPASLPTDR
jgi:hypothetical protein